MKKVFYMLLFIVTLCLTIFIINNRVCATRQLDVEWEDLLDFTVIDDTTENDTEFFNQAVYEDDNSIIAVGKLSGKVTIDGTEYTPKGTYDALIVKYDTNGNILWIKQVSGSYDGTDTHEEAFYGVSINSSGEIVVGGYIYGDSDVYVNGNVEYSNSGITTNSLQGIVMKLTKDGEVTFVDTLYTTSSAMGANIYSVDINDDGEIVIGGQFAYNMDVLGVTYKGNAAYDGFIIKYDSYGNKEWFNQINSYTTSLGQVNCVKFDNENNVVALAFTTRYFKIGSTAITLSEKSGSKYYPCMIIEKYDEDGNLLHYDWQGDSGTSYWGLDLVIDNDNNYYVGGAYLYGSTVQNSAYNGKIYKYDKDLNLTIDYSTDFAISGIALLSESNGGNIITYGWDLYDEDLSRRYALIKEYTESGSNISLSSTLYSYEYSYKIESEESMIYVRSAFNNGAVDTNDNIIAVGNLYLEDEYYYDLTGYHILTAYTAKIIKLSPATYYEVTIKATNEEGGTVAGSESVKSGNDSTENMIVITPYTGWEVSKITINGEEIEFTANSDGVVYLDNFKNMSEDKEIIVTFSQISAVVNVKYIDINTDDEIEKSVTIDGYIGKEYETEKKTITGYTFIKNTNNTSGTMIEENTEVIYYYSKDTNVVVKYIDINTDKEIEESVTIDGYIGKEYETEKKNITGYTFIKSTDNISGTMTKDTIEVIYYYGYDTYIIVNHIDINTNELLEKVVDSGYVGDTYNTSSCDFTGYILVKNPDAETYTLTKETIEITYYYAKVSSGIIVKYVDINSNEILSNYVIGEGYVGQEYKTEQKNIAGYSFVQSTNNTTGTMTEEVIEVIYYYKKETSVIVKYIDIDTDEEISDMITIDGYVADEYETEKKTIAGYTFIKSTDNISGTMTKDVIEVIYYYSKDTNVVVKYIDINTDKEIEESVTIDGYIGKEYETEKKTIAGYTFIKSTDNISGTMTEEVIEIIYYYKKETSVIVKYIDIDTDEEIEESVTIDGYIGKEYETEKKTISGYTFIKNTDNTSGTMVEDKIEIIYYYNKDIENTESEIEDSIETNLQDDESSNDNKNSTVSDSTVSSSTSDESEEDIVQTNDYIYLAIFIITLVLTLNIIRYIIYRRKKCN